MPKLPVLSGKRLLRLLLKHGYTALRQKGSHVFVENADGTVGTAIPLHGNEDLGPGILTSILRDLDMTIDQLRHML